MSEKQNRLCQRKNFYDWRWGRAGCSRQNAEAPRGEAGLPHPGTVHVRQAVCFFIPAGARRPCGGTPAARYPLDSRQAGLPRCRRPTASGSQLPTLHQAEAGETCFAGGTSALQTADSIGDTASVTPPGRSRRNPLCGRDFRVADGRQHRGVSSQHSTRPKPAKPALRAGLPRCRRPTASGTQLPSLHQAEAGETRFAGGTSALQTADSVGDTASVTPPGRSRRAPLRGRHVMGFGFENMCRERFKR